MQQFAYRLSRLAQPLAAAVSLVLLGFGASVSAEEVVVDRIAAKVEGTVITHTDITRFLPVYVQVVGADPGLFQTTEGRQELGEDVLDHLIEAEILMERSEDRGLAPTDREVEDFLARQRSQMNLSEDDFRRAMAAEGIDPDDFYEFTRRNLARMRMIQVDVVAGINVSADEIERAMAEEYPDGLQELRISTSHIFLSVPQGADEEIENETRARISELREELEAGTPFEDLAAEHNDDGSSRTGGRIGTTRMGDLDPDYERAALEGDVGEIIGPVRTQFGYHLIRLEGREEQEIDDAERVREQVHYQLHERAVERAAERYIRRARSDAYVEIVSTDFGF